jgi:hypothetical protein
MEVKRKQGESLGLPLFYLSLSLAVLSCSLIASVAILSRNCFCRPSLVTIHQCSTCGPVGATDLEKARMKTELAPRVSFNPSSIIINGLRIL